MINIVLIDDDLNYIMKLMNLLSKNDNNFRVCSLLSSFEDNINFKCIDIIFINNKIMEEFKMQIEKYKNKVILVLNNKDKCHLNYDFPYIYKSDTINNIIDVIYKLFKENKVYSEEDDIIKNTIKAELKYLGYNPKYRGTTYLIDVIYILYKNEGIIDENLERTIYPIIAEKYRKTYHNIKCNIIYATDNMVYECKEEKLLKYLGFYEYSKPGPKKVIEAVLSHIHRRKSKSFMNN